VRSICGRPFDYAKDVLVPKVLVLLIAVALAGGVACSQDTQSVTPPTDLAASSSPTSSPSIYVPVSHSPKPPKPARQ
jgi:uncharacterized lipoprotein YajG